MSVETISLGCRLNFAESETIARAAPAGEDWVVVNSCAVTNAAVRETRAGKVLSAANMQKLRTAMQSLRDLMDTALNEEIADGDVAAGLDQGVDEPGERSIVAVELEMRLLEFAAREHAYAA